MAIKESQNSVSWAQWPEALRQREHHVIEQAKLDYKENINFHAFLQYEAYKQWYNLKKLMPIKKALSLLVICPFMCPMTHLMCGPSHNTSN